MTAITVKNTLPTRRLRVGERMRHRRPTTAAGRGLQSFTAGKSFKGTGGSKDKSNWGPTSSLSAPSHPAP